MYDDVEYLKGIMEVAENTQDPILRELALLSLPSGEKADDFYYGLMVSTEQVDGNGNRKYKSESDEEFIRKLYQLEDNRKRYQSSCVVLQSDRQVDVEQVINKIKSTLNLQGNEDLEGLGIISWKNKITSYKNKKGEEVYVRGEDGKIYEYSQHPQRNHEITEITTSGFCLLTTMLRAKGYDEEQIRQAIDIVNEYNKILGQEEKRKDD